jgi:hypothetical protein
MRQNAPAESTEPSTKTTEKGVKKPPDVFAAVAMSMGMSMGMGTGMAGPGQGQAQDARNRARLY